MADDQPVVSVDTKKKELVGEYANKGREWQPTGEPDEVLVHDFIDPESGKAVPYGVFDVANNEGWVSVGDNADTAGFAVNSIRRWWEKMGRERFPEATRLLITADSGGSNGYRIPPSRSSSPSSRKRPGSRSLSVTTHPAPRNLTRSSTASSASSR